jgi:predicted 2-oxoglutarate/Fe(II)-dependent dioxygenase YbiX
VTWTEVAPGILVARAFARDLCAAFVARAEGNPRWSPATINAAMDVDRRVRDAEVLYADLEPDLIGEIHARLAEATHAIALARAPGAELRELQLVRYRAGGTYVDHRDSPSAEATPRRLSVVAYLNDDVLGGALTFPERSFALAPTAGMVVVFAPELLHRAEPVTAGMKYAITAWYHASA